MKIKEGELLHFVNTYNDTIEISVNDVKDRLFKDTDGLWKVERNIRVLSEDGTKTIANSFEVQAPVLEVCDSVFQNKLNKIQSFKGSNYVYTIFDKSDILSPTLHGKIKVKEQESP